MYNKLMDTQISLEEFDVGLVLIDLLIHQVVP